MFTAETDYMTPRAYSRKNNRKRLRNSWISRLAEKTAGGIMAVLRFLKPDALAWNGAGWGMIILVMALILIAAVHIIRPLGIFIVLMYILNIVVLSAAAALAIQLGVNIIGHIPLFFRLALFASIVMLLQYWSGNIATMVVMTGLTLLIGTLLGGVTRVMMRTNWTLLPLEKKLLNVFVILIGIGGLAGGLIWIFYEGPETDPPEIAALKSSNMPAHVTLPDPSLPGDYSVLNLTYGSGRDKHRDEFGDEVTFVTDSVDGSRFVGNWEKFHGRARTRYWGFDEKSLPLNARVWYPGGKGPFPLVLIVHGNHLDRDFPTRDTNTSAG